MKELTIEQKAKAYDEVREKIALRFGSNVVEEIFSEFEMNEDERVRKELVAFLEELSKLGKNTNFDRWKTSDCANWIAWLEKQGEQKVSYTTTVETGDGGINALVTKDIEIPFGAKDSELQEVSYYIPKGYYAKIEGDKVVIKKGEEKPVNYTDEDIVEAVKDASILDMVEPKFKVGYCITNGDYTWKIVGIKPLDYILQSQDGNIVDDTISHVDEQFHSFTIQDAKDGDVLIGKIDGDKYIIIFKRIKDGWVETYGHYNGTLSRFCVPSQLFCRDYQGTFTPATQEQCDLLFKRMKEAGYEWSDKDRKLIKIVK